MFFEHMHQHTSSNNCFKTYFLYVHNDVTHSCILRKFRHSSTVLTLRANFKR